jgi:hypothetical protein
MPKAATPIALTPTQHAELQKLVRAARSPQQTVLRARIVLHADDGEDNTTIAHALRIGANTVARWRGRFATDGLWRGWLMPRAVAVPPGSSRAWWSGCSRK